MPPVLTSSMTIGHSNTPQANTIISGVPQLTQHNTNANFSYQQGFLTGTDISVSFNNQRRTTNSIGAYLIPLLTSKLEAAGLNGAFIEFEETIGEPPRFFHLNDSEGELGSNRDRHTLLGEGRIGVEPFRWLLAHRSSRGIPLILETPQLNYDVADDDPSGDPYDVRMAELLQTLV